VNERIHDHLDDAIDRASRQLVEHDPPARMHSAVTSRLRATRPGGLGSKVRWSLMAAPAVAALFLVLAVGNQPREEGQRDLRASKMTVEPVTVPTIASVALPAAAPAVRNRERRRGGPMAAPGASELAAAVTPIEVSQIRMQSVHVAAIPLEEVAIRPIHITDIDIESR
jgi:hypothetical protein